MCFNQNLLLTCTLVSYILRQTVIDVPLEDIDITSEPPTSEPVGDTIKEIEAPPSTAPQPSGDIEITEVDLSALILHSPSSLSLTVQEPNKGAEATFPLIPSSPCPPSPQPSMAQEPSKGAEVPSVEPAPPSFTENSPRGETSDNLPAENPHRVTINWRSNGEDKRLVFDKKVEAEESGLLNDAIIDVSNLVQVSPSH